MPSIMGCFPGLNRERLRHSLDVAARTLLAIAGGYALTALATASLALLLPLPRAQAVLTATMVSFALYCAVVIGAFTAASAGRAWLGTLACAALPAAHLWLRGAI